MDIVYHLDPSCLVIPLLLRGCHSLTSLAANVDGYGDLDQAFDCSLTRLRLNCSLGEAYAIGGRTLDLLVGCTGESLEVHVGS